MVAARVQLVEVDRRIMSIYDDKHGNPWPLYRMKHSRAPADVAEFLLLLWVEVGRRGGVLRITELGRDRAVSDQAHADYKAGKRKHYAKPGGYSNHNAHRAIDIGLKFLCFPGVPADKQLDVLWECIEAAGGFFTEIVDYPDEQASEAWHFDGMGPWKHVQDRLGADQAAMAACLDVGLGGYGRDEQRALQAQLHRCGQDVGPIDGYIGAATRAGLQALGLPLDSKAEALFVLPAKRYAA